MESFNANSPPPKHIRFRWFPLCLCSSFLSRANAKSWPPERYRCITQWINYVDRFFLSGYSSANANRFAFFLPFCINIFSQFFCQWLMSKDNRSRTVDILLSSKYSTHMSGGWGTEDGQLLEETEQVDDGKSQVRPGFCAFTLGFQEAHFYFYFFCPRHFFLSVKNLRQEKGG